MDGCELRKRDGDGEVEDWNALEVHRGVSQQRGGSVGRERMVGSGGKRHGAGSELVVRRKMEQEERMDGQKSERV